MSEEPPFNPLDIPSVALSLALEVLEQPLHLLPPAEPVQGTGIYLLYYSGDFSPYQPLTAGESESSRRLVPIYVGKAERKGKRKGFSFAPIKDSPITQRLKMHGNSIEAVDNLELGDFLCRFRVIDEAFVGLAESVLISVFNPIWNVILDGFGNNPTGGPRSTQKQSKWDVFHPGRRRGMGEAKYKINDLLVEVKNHLEKSEHEKTADEKLELIKQRIRKYGLG